MRIGRGRDKHVAGKKTRVLQWERREAIKFGNYVLDSKSHATGAMSSTATLAMRLLYKEILRSCSNRLGSEDCNGTVGRNILYSFLYSLG